MNTLIAVLIALLVFSLVVWIVDLTPLPPVPKRIAQAAIGIFILVSILRHLHWRIL